MLGCDDNFKSSKIRVFFASLFERMAVTRQEYSIVEVAALSIEK